MSATNIDKPKYAILNNYGDLTTVREDDFDKRVKLVTTVSELGETFRQFNFDEHPGMKAMLAEKQKEMDKEMKESESLREEAAEQRSHLNNIPDQMINEQLMDKSARMAGEGKMEESVYDYVVDNFFTSGSEDSEPIDMQPDSEWEDHISAAKDEL